MVVSLQMVLVPVPVLMSMVAGAEPHLNLTSPPPARAAFKAASVQLAAVPVPTTFGPSRQFASHPSPLIRLPSSHSSPAVTTPSPQMVHELVQPSDGLVFPSSHCSPASTMPLPH